MQKNKETGPNEEMAMEVLWNLQSCLFCICLTVCLLGASFYKLSWQAPQTPLYSFLPLSPLMRTCVTPTLPSPSHSFKTIIREMIKIGFLIDLSLLPNAPSFEWLTCFLSNTANSSSTTWPAHLLFVHLLSWSPESWGRGQGGLPSRRAAGYHGGAGSTCPQSPGGRAWALPSLCPPCRDWCEGTGLSRTWGPCSKPGCPQRDKHLCTTWVLILGPFYSQQLHLRAVRLELWGDWMSSEGLRAHQRHRQADGMLCSHSNPRTGGACAVVGGSLWVPRPFL